MSRSIKTAATAASGSRTRGGLDEDVFSAPADVDGYADRMVKLIPAEVVAFYLFATSSLENATAANRCDTQGTGAACLSTAAAGGDITVAAVVPWVLFFFGAFATYFYMRYPLKVTNSRQLGLTVGAFGVWAFSLGYPFTVFEWYLEAYGGILLAAYTLIAPHVPLDSAS